MKPDRYSRCLLIAGSLSTAADAALLHIEFAGGGSEVTLAASDTVQIDVLWTMQPTDKAQSRLTGVDLRFNVNSEPNPDGPERGDKFLVQSLTTPVPGWDTDQALGVGGMFSGDNFFLSAIDPESTDGITGNGTEFTTVIASFVLHKADFQPGDTYITFRHRFRGAVLPSAYNGVLSWSHQFQGNVDGPNEYRLGLGNPGDAGPQWDPYHGLETFQPLIIHNVPEPEMIALLGFGCLGLIAHRRATKATVGSRGYVTRVGSIQVAMAAFVTITIISSARAGLLYMEFTGGGNEVTMAPLETVQIDILWTMHATDKANNRMTGVDLRFNVNDVPNSDGSSAPEKFTVRSVTTPIAGWSTAQSLGIGGPFSLDGFFLSAIHDQGVLGPVGNGTQFATVVASFVLEKADFEPGDTYISFVHYPVLDFLPGVYDGPANWALRWQADITGPGQFDIGQGNPGDAGPQWDPYHGYETFQPLIIHNVPEPGALAPLVVGLALLRRRRIEPMM